VTPLAHQLQIALRAREPLFDARHEAAFRLFNGFTEGCPSLAADLYAESLVLHDYADEAQTGADIVSEAQAVYRAHLPWLRAILVKTRGARDRHERNGTIAFGDAPNHWVREQDVRYAIDLTLNRDASLYLDTRNVRAWARESLHAATVLNTFAYTGSLGVAAQAGGAKRVVHLDLNRQFLNVAKTSYTLNGFAIHKPDFIAADFWPAISRLKRSGDLFDCIFLDPPFFSVTPKGALDMTDDITRLINKVRPLIRDGGALVVINNALFMSGADMLRELDTLCTDGYLGIERTIPVPDDFTGYAHTRVFPQLPAGEGGHDSHSPYPVSPAPFNHPTKIVVLRVRHTSPARD